MRFPQTNERVAVIASLLICLSLLACQADDAYDADQVPPQPCQAEEDDGSDGSVDLFWTYTYDENNKRLRSVALDRDGVEVESSDFTWDGDNLLESRRLGQHVHQIKKNTYDEAGNRLTHSYDYDGDGTIDLTFVTTYNVDSAVALDIRDDRWTGTITTRNHEYEDGRLARVSVEDAYNGSIATSKELYHYDEAGLLLTIETVIEGESTKWTENSYDDIGNVILRTYKVEEKVVQVERDEFDAAGNRTLHEIDHGGHGLFDTYLATPYDDDGRLLSFEYGGLSTWVHNPEFTRYIYACSSEPLK